MKRLLLCLTAASLCAGAWATPLSPEEALRSALSYGRRAAIPAIKAEKSYSLVWSGPDAGTYVFNSSRGGYLIASGNSDFDALIGYSDSGSFDPADIPDGLAAVLRAFDSQISAGLRPAPAVRASREAIAPMVRTKWNQDAPYNLLTPKLNGESTLTGCAATAAAQVLKYRSYPAKGTGTASYKWSSGGKTLSFDYDTNPFDYALMLDEYDASTTAAQNNAVANLMFGCGVAFKMDYTTSFSGATDMEVCQGLSEYLGFDKSMKLLYRDFYTADEWNNLVYADLKANGPMLYYGFSPLGGHAFVVDGYEGRDGYDYYHLNWGWAGLSDGYFMLNALNPESLGLGGSAGGFNIMQSAIFNLLPGAQGDGKVYDQLLCFGFFAPGADRYNRGETMLFGVASGMMRAGFYNMSLEKIRVQPGIKLTPAGGGAPAYLSSVATLSLSPGAGTDRFSVKAYNLPAAGTYRVTPVWRYDGTSEWADMPQEVYMRTAMTMTIDADGNISLEAVTDSSELRFEDVSLSTSVITVGQPFTISYSGISHNFDEEETLTPVLINSQSAIIAYAESHTIRGYSGEMFEGKWQVVFNGDIKPGGYSVAVITEKMMPVCNPIPVAVIDDRTEVSWEVTNVRINRQLASPEMNVIAGDEMSASCRAELISGAYSGDIAAMIFDASDNIVRALADGKDAPSVPGEYATLTFKGSLNGLDNSKTYKVGFCTLAGDRPTLISSLYPFTCPDAALTDIAAGSDSEAVYFDLFGRRVDSPAPGQILVRLRSGSADKIIIK